jgi:DNA gyrase subunit A
MQRPDLSKVDLVIRRYIDYLEAQLGIPQIRSNKSDLDLADDDKLLFESLPAEPETSIGILTISNGRYVKRTLRHLYHRQHRGGMGVFDIDINPPDFPDLLGMANENQTMLLFTNRGRVFRFNFQGIEPAPIRGKGVLPFDRLPFEEDETLVAILPEQARGYIAFLSKSGRVRCLRHHLFGEHMRPGTSVYNLSEFGTLAAACWTPGDADLFLISRMGMGIRFNEKAISPQGDLGIRLSAGDAAVGITSANDESEILIVSADGKGTIRQMTGFAPNKSPGGSGKIAMKNPSIIGASAIHAQDDIFIITRQAKIIRFKADEIPSTDGVVQGVNCVMLRLDEVSAFLTCSMTSE